MLFCFDLAYGGECERRREKVVVPDLAHHVVACQTTLLD